MLFVRELRFRGWACMSCGYKEGRRRTPAVKPALVHEIQVLYRQGIAMVRLSELYSVSYRTINRICYHDGAYADKGNGKCVK